MSAATGPWTEEESLVVFLVGTSRFGIPTRSIRSILWAPELAAPEEMPPAVLGMFNLHGTVVPVVDLLHRLGHERETYGVAATVLVVETTRGPVGVLAESLCEVSDGHGLSAAAGAGHTVLSGASEAGDDVVLVVDPEALLDGGSVPDSLPEPPAEPLVGALEELATLRARAVDYATPLEAEEDDALVGLVVVRVEDERLGLPLDGIREVCVLGEVTPIPCCPPHVVGLMNLRGELVVVMDVREALGLVPREDARTGEVAVCSWDENLLGIRVSEVLDIHMVAAAAIWPPPAATPAQGISHITGEVSVDGHMVTILDLHGLLTSGVLSVDEVVV